MKAEVLNIWPEINWIKDEELREKTLDAWVWAIENSVFSPGDLQSIPFTLLVKDCNISFMNHKRTCVQLAVSIAEIMKKNFGNAIDINMDILIAGAILCDIGKLLEYGKSADSLTVSSMGKFVRHTFSGTAIAFKFKLPPEVQHIVATHSGEGDLGKRSVESTIVHHADFVSFNAIKAQLLQP